MAPQDLSDFLGALKLSPRSFNNHVLLLQTFFRFCQARGWLSRDADLLGSVERRRNASHDIEIFSVAEMRKILAVAQSRVATCIAIQGFAGVRTAELLRLDWTDLERRAGYIEISASKAKTASRRLVPISENLSKWLVVHGPRSEGRIWPVTASEYYDRLAATAKMAGMNWRANALRHSFISYRLAQTKDIAATALEAGNSPKMIFAHYRELCTESEARGWFGLLPAVEGLDNLVPIQARTAVA